MSGTDQAGGEQDSGVGLRGRGREWERKGDKDNARTNEHGAYPFSCSLFQVKQPVIISLAEPADVEPLRITGVKAAGPGEGASLTVDVAVAPRDVRLSAMTKVDRGIGSERWKLWVKPRLGEAVFNESPAGEGMSVNMIVSTGC